MTKTELIEKLFLKADKVHNVSAIRQKQNPFDSIGSFNLCRVFRRPIFRPKQQDEVKRKLGKEMFTIKTELIVLGLETQ